MPTENLENRRLASLGRLLGLSWAVVERRVIAGVHRRGFADFRPPYAALTRSMSLEGTRVTVLAERAGVTKQAMSQLVKSLAAKGYVRMEPDPTDGRAGRVAYTKKGLALAKAIVESAEEAEAEFTAVLGPREAARLRNLLRKALDALYPKHESFWST